MLDIKLIRENPDFVKENIRKKFQDQKLVLVDEVIDLLDELGIVFNTLSIDKKGVRVLKDVGDKEVPIFWVDEFEKLEEILIDIKNGALAHPGDT